MREQRGMRERRAAVRGTEHRVGSGQRVGRGTPGTHMLCRAAMNCSSAGMVPDSWLWLMSTYWVMVMYLMEVGMPPEMPLLDTFLAGGTGRSSGEVEGQQRVSMQPPHPVPSRDSTTWALLSDGGTARTGT